MSNDLEEVEEAVWASAVSPRCWFARMAAVGVVVAVSCFHGMMVEKPTYPL